MDTKQLIQASAEVITIASFKAGDVYKRIETGPYAGGEPTLRFGIVQDVMNNGSDSAFTAIEFRADYTSGVTVETKVFDGNRPAALFSAVPAEVAQHVEEVRKSALDKERRAAQALDEARRAVELVTEVCERVAAAAVSTPDVVRGEVDSASA